MRVVIIDQARMQSTRLPGKILKQVMGKSLLEYQIERLCRVKRADDIVIATTIGEAEQPIVDLCEKLGVSFFRGSEEDVLSRYYQAALLQNADVVVRVTSDCPIIDPGVVDQIIAFYLDQLPQFDYVSNCRERSFPRGMDTEVFSFKALEEAHRLATEKEHREHVTPFISLSPERYRLGHVAHDRDESRHRWTVDVEEDFELMRRIIEALYPAKPEFTMQDCLDLLSQYPEWSRINTKKTHVYYGES